MPTLLDTSVEGTPAGCRAAAAALRATLAPSGHARRFLADQRALPHADLGDHAGTAYRTACRRLHHDLGEPRRDVRALADALEQYADALRDVVGVMERVREVGAWYRFTESAHLLRRPTAPADEELVAWRLLEQRVADAQQADWVAKQAWREAYVLVIGVAPPAQRGTPPTCPVSPQPWPPTDDQWPRPPWQPPPREEPAGGPGASPVAPPAGTGASDRPPPAPPRADPLPPDGTLRAPPGSGPWRDPAPLAARFATAEDPPPPPSSPEALTNRPWEGPIMLDHNDINLAVPGDWHRRADPESGVILSARPVGVPPSGYVPDVVLRAAPVDDALVPWRDEAMADLGRRLPGFALEDADEYDLGEHEVAYRRFAHSFGSTDVLVDQWAWQVDGTGVTLTCSTAREDYPAYCDLFEMIASTVDVVPRAA